MKEPVFPLGNVAERVTVSHVGPTSAHFCENGVPFLRTGNVGERRILFHNLKTITPKFHSVLKKSTLKVGDIVVSRVISDKITCAVIPFQLNGANCGNIIIIRPGQRLVPEYLAHLISSPLGQRKLLQHRVGSAQSVVNTTVLQSWPIPVPPLPKQRRIAAILDKTDSLREKRRQAIAKLDELLKSVFIAMFGDPIINPKGWGKVKLKEVCNGITDGVHATPKYQESGVPFISTIHLTEHGIKWDEAKFISEEEHRKLIQRCRPQVGNVLYTKVGSVGLALPIIEEKEFSIFVQLALIKPDSKKCDFLFLSQLLNMPSLRHSVVARLSGATMKYIGIGEIGRILIMLPPLALQRKFSQVLQKVHALRSRLTKAEEKADQLFQSLQQRAFSGELFTEKTVSTPLLTEVAQHA